MSQEQRPPSNGKRNDSANKPDEHSVPGMIGNVIGAMYQLKLLILFLHRGVGHKYNFRLASELDAAEKFDDLVFRYEKTNDHGEPVFVYRFLQAKHKQDEKKIIKYEDLMADNTKDEFELSKYFDSYRKIKQKPEFKGELKDFIICTNIDFDLEALKEAGITPNQIKEPDNLLDLKNCEKEPKRYKLSVDKNHELYHKLKGTSDLCKIAKELAKSMKGEQKIINLRTAIFKTYHSVLAHILDKKDNKIKFNSKVLKYFQDENVTQLVALPGNLKDFIIALREALNNEQINLNTLDGYEFGIRNFQTSEKDGEGNTALPRDKVKNEEIDEFFRKLTFAVNQPNEIELGEIINKEIGIFFNLIDSDLINGYSQKVILDWFKKRGDKGNGGTFFTKMEADELFKIIKGKIARSSFILSKLEYKAIIKAFGIEFEQKIINKLPLRDFLDTKNTAKVFHLVTEYIPLSAIKAYQVLQGIPEYKADDSFVFTTLESLLRLQEYVITALQSTNLLVIECKEHGSITEKKVRNVYEKLCETIIDKPNKKIVVIGKHGNALSNQLNNDSKLTAEFKETINDKNNFTDLTTESQNKVLRKSYAEFQGYTIRLAGTINNERKELIDAETLVKLISKDKVTIGQPLQSLGDIENYYINRTFNYQIEINTDIFQATKNYTLAISGIDKLNLSKLVRHENKICLLKDYDINNSSNVKFIILDNIEAEEQFRQLQEKYKDQETSIHWLKRQESGQFFWQQSQGLLTELYEYVKKDENHTKILPEIDFLREIQHKKVVIISDTAGMGKSTILTKLAQKIKENDPTLWIVRVDLNDHTKQLEKQKDKCGLSAKNFDEVMKFLKEDLIKLFGPSFEETFFKNYYHKMVVIFDGFDEISPHYRETVINLIYKLQNSTIKQILVTTRPHEKKELENQLLQFAYTLNRFSEKNQIEFLRKYWTQKLKITEVNKTHETKLNDYAKSLIELLAKSISDKNKELTGIPLQTKMIAEVFENDFAEYYNSNKAEMKLPNKLGLSDLYERFLKKKHQICEEEKIKLDVSKPANQNSDSYKNFIEKLQNLALYALFDNEKREYLLEVKFCHEFCKESPGLFEKIHEDTELKSILVQPKYKKLDQFINDIKQGKFNSGIIDEVIENKPHFIHRTFAEYLVAKFLVDNSQDETVIQFMLEEILLRQDCQVIRAFIDDQLASNYLSVDTSAISENQLAAIWQSNDNTKLYARYGYTLLHLAAEEGNINIIQFLFNKLGNKPEILKDLVNTFTLDWKHQTALHLAVKNNFLHIVQLLVNQEADVNAAKRYGKTALHIASKEGNLDIIKYLVQNKAEVNAASEDGETAIHIAAEKDNFDIIRYLVEKGAGVNTANIYGSTALHIAAEKDNLDIIRYLIEKGADVNASNRCGASPLIFATKRDNLDIIRYLVEKGANANASNMCGASALHFAAKRGNLDIIRYLLEKGVNVNAASEDGETALHIAAEKDNWDIIKYLVEKGADVNAGNGHGNTALQIAAEKDNWDIIKYLVEKGADVNTEFNDFSKKGETVLHFAAKKGNLDIIRYLVENGADVNAANRNGGTALYFAAKEGNLDIIRYLVEKGAEVNAANKNDGTALYIAAEKFNLDIINFLKTKGPDVGEMEK